MKNYLQNNRFRMTALSLIGLLAVASCSHPGAKKSVQQRLPAEAVEKPGLPNFYRVSEQLYRGAQPEAEGFKSLVGLGIKTVVNLRLINSDRDEILEAGASEQLALEQIKMAAWNAETDDIIAFLKIAVDTTKQPVFVHCKHGADRTGAMVAAYRVVVQGWSKEEAVDEMVNGPFGFHEIWKGLPDLIRDMDMEKIGKEAGIARQDRAGQQRGKSDE